ncbi:MAG: hypothetical protein H0X66_12515 [Verrucomicrobia bacterium]|nr:hypothetical protein [Verrucomicrobiota bacterium]
MKWVINNTLVVLCLFAFTVSAKAVVHYVDIYPNSFSPSTLTINVGDSVIWVNQYDDFHTVASSTGAFGTMTFIDEGDMYGHTFQSVGTYSYFDHFSSATGSITVQAGGGGPVNSPPSVNIATPMNNALFGAPANFTVSATAADFDGSVANVQFFLDGLDLGTVTSDPFTVDASNIPAGTYSLSAIATDNEGATASDSIIVVVMDRPAITGQSVSGGQFSFQMNVPSGRTHVVEASTNLAQWTPISTNFVAGSVFSFTDTDSSNQKRFYRVETR